VTLKLNALRCMMSKAESGFKRTRWLQPPPHLDERDGVARRCDDAFEQRQLLADELMRRNDHQDCRICKHVEFTIYGQTTNTRTTAPNS